jgi:hypothetical protein
MSASQYPYSIPPVDLKQVHSKVRPLSAHEFFLVEALLRTPKIIKLYKHDKTAFDAYWRDNHGELSRNPLAGSHHLLILKDRQFEQELLRIGYLDVGLGILDLGTIARLPRGAALRHGPIEIVGSYDGARECALRLRSTNPQFLHLRLDLSHPPQAILERLELILDAQCRRVRGKRKKDVSALLQREAVSLKKIETYMRYLRCYDLQREGLPIDQIANKVYAGSDNRDGTTAQALRRARALIRSVGLTRRVPFLLA